MDTPVGVKAEHSPGLVRAPARQARILIVEADAHQRSELSALLNSGISCLVKDAVDEAGGVRLATTWFPNLITFNPLAASDGGQRFCRTIKAMPELQATYVLMLSDEATVRHFGSDPDVEADDYLALPCGAVELLARVRCGLRVRDLQHKLASRNRCLQQFALVDPITGLLNSRAVTQVLVAEQNRAQHEDRPFSVLLGNVEFRERGWWDRPGSELREEVMQAAAQVLVDNVRSTDFVAQRTSGEFIVVLPGISQKESQQVASRLAGLVERLYLELPSSTVGVTVSFREFAINPQRNR